MAVKGGGMGFSLLVALFLARILGPHDYGLYAYAYALITLLAVPATLGLPSLVIREASVAQSAGDWSTLAGLARWSGGVACGMSLFMVIAGGIACWFWASDSKNLSFSVMVWALVVLPGLVLPRVAGGALQGLRRVVAGQLPDSIIRPGLFVAFLLVALCIGGSGGLTASRAMALHALAAALAVLASAVLLRRAWPVDGVQKTGPQYRHRAWAGSILPLGLIMGIQIINRQADIIILGIFHSPADVGIYRVAMQGSMLVVFGLQAVNMVAGPQYARLHARGEHGKLQGVVTATARSALALALPVVILFVLFGGWLLSNFIGPGYAAGAIPLMILALGQLVNAGMGSVLLLLNMTHNERAVVKVVAFAAVFNVAANFLLVPSFGMTGAAIATATTCILWNTILVVITARRLGINTTVFTRKQVRF